MSLLFDVWLLMHAASALLDEALAPSGLSGDDFGLYSLLRRFGPATPTQVSRWTGMRPTTVSVALKRLLARGHSEERPNPADGRSRLVTLSEAGAAAHQQAALLFLDAAAELSTELADTEPAARLALQRIDLAFRAVLELDPRPYRLAEEFLAGTSNWQLTYSGPPLDPDEESLVRRYIDFVRSS